MKALVVNALGRGFDLEDVDIAVPMGREVLIDVQASGALPHRPPVRDPRYRADTCGVGPRGLGHRL